MSRLPSVSTGIPSKRLQRQPSLDARKSRQQQADALPPLRTSKSTRVSRTSMSSYDDTDSPSPRFSSSSYGSATTVTSATSPRNSLPSGPRKRVSAKPPPIPAHHRPNVRSPTSQGDLRLGDRVLVDSMNIVGTLKFLGPIPAKQGVWAGIQLDIIGTGKNDGSFQGARYFSCPPETGIFVTSSKVAPLNDEPRTPSPPSPQATRTLSRTQNRQLTTSRITKGSRAERYLGMTAKQLTQRQPSQPSSAPQQPQQRRPLTRNGTTSSRSTSSAGKRLSSASTASNGSRKYSVGSMGSPTPSHHRPTSLTAAAVAAQQHHHPNEDDQDDQLLLETDENSQLLDTPVPLNLATSESTEASGEWTTQFHQLQMRIEALEAENKYLKVENTQNKTSAEQLFERSMVLRKQPKDEGKDPNTAHPANADNADAEPMFTLQAHKTIVDEIKQEHETKRKAWTSDLETLQSTIKKLEQRVFELETEQSELIKERDELLGKLAEGRKMQSQLEHQVQELEQKVVVAEANAAAALASKTVQTTANFYSDDPDAMQERQRQMELEMEEVHEKLMSVTEAMHAKDIFFATLSDQVEQHRNMVEDKERELRRLRLDMEKTHRDNDRLREELNEMHTKFEAHANCVTHDEFEHLKRAHAVAKEQLSKETSTVDDYRKRIASLEETVGDLKQAGMESLELYENSVELHRVAMDTIQRQLQEEHHKVVALETDKELTAKAHADAMDTSDETIAFLKEQHAAKIDAFAVERQGWEATIAKLKHDIHELIDSGNAEDKQAMDKLKQAWSLEREQLQAQADQVKQQWVLEQQEHAATRQAMEQTKTEGQESKQAMQQLASRLQQLEQQYNEAHTARTKLQDDWTALAEQHKKAETDLRRMTEQKEKHERSLAMARADLEKSEAMLKSLRSSSSDMDAWIQGKEGENKEIAMLRQEIDRLEAQNEMLEKQQKMNSGDAVQRLKTENKQLAKDYDALKQEHQQLETECLKWMDEVEKLHHENQADASPNAPNDSDATQLPSNSSNSPQIENLQRQLERQQLEHRAALRKISDELKEAERKHQREIKTLNRDITELEGIIEGKIFKEADLEEALEKERKTVKRLRNDIADLHTENAATKQNGRPALLDTSATSTTVSTATSTASNPSEAALYCEICEVHGHDLMSCKAVLDDIPKDNAVYCENCDIHDQHHTSDCPSQNETF